MRSGTRIPSTADDSLDPAASARAGNLVWAAAFALTLVHIVLAWLLRNQIGMGNDDAIYLQLSHSLRSLSYREEFLVGAPWHSQYPPIYPLFLALVSTITGDAVEVPLAATVLLSAGALLLVFDAVRRVWSPMLALMVLAVSAVNLFLLENAGGIASEAPYMALSALSLWFMARRPDTKISVGMAGAAAIAAALTRSVGVMLVAALVLLWLVEHHYRRALILGATAALLIGSWLAWTLVSPDKEAGRSYVGDASQIIGKPAKSFEKNASSISGAHLARFKRNTRDYLTASLPFRMQVPTISGTLVDNIIWLLLFAACSVLGAIMIWLSAWRSVVVYLLLYMGLLVVWLWPVARFLDPILPFVFLTLLTGAGTLGKRLFPLASWVPALALTLIITASSLVQLAPVLASAVSCDRLARLQSTGCFNPQERAWLTAALYARERTPADTRFLSSKEGAFGYHSDRKLVAIGSVLGDGSVSIIGRMKDANVSYIVIGTGTGREDDLRKALFPVCDRLQVVQVFPPQAAILKVLPGSQTDHARSACPFLA